MKKVMIKHVVEELAPIREKRAASKINHNKSRKSWRTATGAHKKKRPRP